MGAGASTDLPDGSRNLAGELPTIAAPAGKSSSYHINKKSKTRPGKNRSSTVTAMEVVKVDPLNNNSQSNSRRLSGSDPKKPPPTMHSATDTSITVQWRVVEPALLAYDRFELQYFLYTDDYYYSLMDTPDEMTWLVAGASNAGTKTTVEGLKPNSQYVFRVRRHNHGDFTGPSHPMRTNCGIPGVPANVRFGEATVNIITVEWDPPPDNGSPIAGYVVEQRQIPVGEYEEVTRGHLSTCSCVALNLEPAKRFEFRIRAWNDVGDGDWSVPGVTLTPPLEELPDVAEAKQDTRTRSQIIEKGEDALSQAAEAQAAELQDLNTFLNRAGIRRLSLSKYGGVGSGIANMSDAEALSLLGNLVDGIEDGDQDTEGIENEDENRGVGEEKGTGQGGDEKGVAESKPDEGVSPSPAMLDTARIQEFENFSTDMERAEFLSMLEPEDQALFTEYMRLREEEQQFAARAQAEANRREGDTSAAEEEAAQQQQAAEDEDPAATMEATADMLVGWQECWDPSSQRNYYWHTHTDLVVWELPPGATTEHPTGFIGKRDLFFRQIQFVVDQSGLPRPVEIRRSHLLEDSFRQLDQMGKTALHGRLRITFQNEPGIDSGGLTKDWFLTVSTSMLDEQLALFKKADDGTYFISTNSAANDRHLAYFYFYGSFLGKAVVDKQIVFANLSSLLYKHMLDLKIDLEDLKEADPAFYQSSKWMLDHDITDILYETFSAEQESFGVTTTIDLKPGGRDIDVTNENKREYLDLLVEYKVRGSVKEQLERFLRGWHDSVPLPLLANFTGHELELLLNGQQEIDVSIIRSSVKYQGGYKSGDRVVEWFWEAFRYFSQEEKSLLLKFVTGTTKVPYDGFDPPFNLTKSDMEPEALPRSHTCFNQLVLPEYRSYDTMVEKLRFAARNTEGFELT